MSMSLSDLTLVKLSLSDRRQTSESDCFKLQFDCELKKITSELHWIPSSFFDISGNWETHCKSQVNKTWEVCLKTKIWCGATIGAAVNFSISVTTKKVEYSRIFFSPWDFVEVYLVIRRFFGHLIYHLKICITDECCHHPGAPVFHDAYKGWSCCNKKSVDFTEFLNIKGCTMSKHSNVVGQFKLSFMIKPYNMTWYRRNQFWTKTDLLS